MVLRLENKKYIVVVRMVMLFFIVADEFSVKKIKYKLKF